MRKLDKFHMQTAWLLSKESSCVSKKVGCLIVKDRTIIATGYNGTTSGYINCYEHAKEQGWLVNVNGVEHLDSKYRTNHNEWSGRYEFHAEQNAIDHALKNNLNVTGATMFCTLSPCIECSKRIVNSGISRLVYSEVYDLGDDDWIVYLEEQGVEVQRILKDEIDDQDNPYFTEIEFDFVY